MYKFIIFSPPYDENSGGQICLHKLCHILNSIGYEAYLYPSFENEEISIRNIIIPILKVARNIFQKFMPYRLNKEFNTPIYSGNEYWHNKNKWIVIYGEQIFGNPLNAKNVVRWFLHKPGYHTGQVYYGYNELHVQHGIVGYDFQYPWSKAANTILNVVHYPFQYYNLEGVSNKRVGVAYCIRKGRHRNLNKNIPGGILIDNLSHEKISNIFKKAEKFISYDLNTSYSSLAALCGCTSIVVPLEGLSEEEWHPNIEERYGIAYGFDNIPKAEATKHMVLNYLKKLEANSIENVKNFVIEASEYFAKEKINHFKKLN